METAADLDKRARAKWAEADQLEEKSDAARAEGWALKRQAIAASLEEDNAALARSRA